MDTWKAVAGAREQLAEALREEPEIVVCRACGEEYVPPAECGFCTGALASPWRANGRWLTPIPTDLPLLTRCEDCGSPFASMAFKRFDQSGTDRVCVSCAGVPLGVLASDWIHGRDRDHGDSD